MSIAKVIKLVKRNKRFLITSHTNPEGDSLGSELAFYKLLKALGKNATIINEDSIPYGYDFLPGKSAILKYKDNIRKKIKFDCLVVLDCSDLKRTGEAYRINDEDKPVINIDHHISNEYFGTVNWIDPDASSTCEMVYRLYKRLGIRFDNNSALYLYAGMLTDSGSFRYTNTSPATHKAVSELLKFGINVQKVYNNVYENIPLEDMQLFSKILPKIKSEASGKIIWFEIRGDLLKNKKLSFDLSEHILSFGRAIKDVEVVALFKENLGRKNEIRVNLRSQGKTDVNKIAQIFGGGGHKTAAGITIRGKIKEIERKVLTKIRDNLK